MAVPNKVILYQSNDQFIEIDGLQDAITGAYLNTATVTATLVDGQGQPVAGCTNITLTYLAGTNGNYRGQVSNIFDPALGGYTLVIDAVQASTKLHLEIRASVQVRRA